MADEGKGVATGRLILDFIKAFLWPGVVVLAFLLYEGDIRKLLTEREWSIGGVISVGKKVDDIRTRTVEEISDLHALVRNALKGREGTKLATDIEEKFKNLGANFGQEMVRVTDDAYELAGRQSETQAPVQGQSLSSQTATPSTAQRPLSRRERASAAERRGLEALVSKDIDAAIKAFSEAVEAWPEYHNVSEIRKMLVERQSRLTTANADEWAIVYRMITTRYSWGLPSDVRDKLRERTAQAY